MHFKTFSYNAVLLLYFVINLCIIIISLGIGNNFVDYMDRGL